MDISVWNIATVFSKVVIYIGFAALLANPLLYCSVHYNKLWHRYVQRWFFIGATLAAIFSIALFLVRVAAFSESGLSGMFDTSMMSFLWGSGVGSALKLRLLAVVTLTVAALTFLLFSNRSARVISALLYVTGIVALGFSFSFIGHTAALPSWSSIVIGFHVLIALSWLGALLPLSRACHYFETTYLKKVMDGFSQLALPLVMILLSLGGYLVYLLLSSPSMLINMPYGNLILVKGFLVLCLLLIAARHKFFLVPALAAQNSVEQDTAKVTLSRSIKIEFAVAACVVVMTAVLSTLVGPSH